MNSKSQKQNYKFSLLNTKDKYYAQLLIDENGSSIEDLIKNSNFYYYTINTGAAKNSGYTISISKIISKDDDYRLRFFEQGKSYHIINNEVDKILKNLRIDFSSTYSLIKISIIMNKLLKKILIYQSFS